jgi:hypothetical protein
MPDYTLCLPFDRDDAEFVNGVEIGMLWSKLQAGERPEGIPVHAANAEMVLRMAEAVGLGVHSVYDDDEWLNVTFEQPGE